MKHVNQTWVPILDEAIRTSISRFSSENEGDILADLYIFSDEEAGIHFYDDLERKLHAISLDKASENDSSLFEKQLASTLRHVLHKLDEEKFFDRNFIFKPFTISLVDKDFTVTEELVFIDDNTVKLEGDLLAGLDEELDSFLKNLMNT
ncbi:hypothetical protein LJC52_00520 [Bacteroidales bacterium OttesenSCG-928-A17]|nr:hypothetical protein [Bacteroidales bacterium OttesenSCG-928-A17]